MAASPNKGIAPPNATRPNQRKQPVPLLFFPGTIFALDIPHLSFWVIHDRDPHYAQGMALTGDYDIVCCGHDHRVSVTPVRNIKDGTTWLVNPGTVGGVGKGPTYILADLDKLIFDIYDVPTEPGEACNVRPASVHV